MVKKRRRREAGAAAVEFGLILPLLLILLLGIMDYGYLFFVQLSVTNAAREGARAGITQGDTSLAQTKAQTATQNYLTSIGITPGAVTATLSCPTLTVTINKPFTALIGFVPVPSNVHASAAMRWELANADDTCS
jgi:Flp pilus assembly protein TadG